MYLECFPFSSYAYGVNGLVQVRQLLLNIRLVWLAGCCRRLSGPSVLTLTEEETAFAVGLLSRLGAGERTCLSVAFHRQGLLVCSDLDARKVARQYGVPTTGTIGILVACVQHDLLSHDEANALLMDLIAAGYRAPVDNLVSLPD